MGFEDVSNSELWSFIIAVISLAFIFGFVVPAIVIAAIYNFKQKSKILHHSKSYFYLLSANILLFVASALFIYFQWTTPLPGFVLFIFAWLLTQFMAIKLISAGPNK
ncbi:hypothetical protein H6800_01525 [Candidatus Nomurabacteria bacterium]|nr:hypothetical protein [Candidatus Nomurabacteria bacterium]